MTTDQTWAIVFRKNDDGSFEVCSRRGTATITKEEEGWSVNGVVILGRTDNRVVRPAKKGEKQVWETSVDTQEKLDDPKEQILGEFKEEKLSLSAAKQLCYHRLSLIPIPVQFSQLNDKTGEAARDKELFATRAAIYAMRNPSEDITHDEPFYNKMMNLSPPPGLPDLEVSERSEGRRRLWSVEEFERLIDLGIFAPDERLELIGGEIVEKMTQNSLHAVALRLMEKKLNLLFGEGYDVRGQLPLTLANKGRPEPDVAVVTGSVLDYRDSHPQTAVLVVEISDTTLATDRTVKASLYASAGIAEYWLVNLPDRVLEVHREPAAMADQPFGHHYRSVTRHTETESIAPLARPDAPIAITELLP